MVTVIRFCKIKGQGHSIIIVITIIMAAGADETRAVLAESRAEARRGAAQKARD